MRTLLIASLLWCPIARAQDTPKPEDAPTDPPVEPAPPGEPMPDLDELLGLPGVDERPERADPAKAELDRKLTMREAANEFIEAARMMDQTAERLQGSKDHGLTTQRLHDEILRKLDMVIATAKRQQSQSSSSSSSSSQSRDPKSQPNQPGRPQQDSGQAGQGENRGEVDPPARREGQLGPEIASAGERWGQLPARVRDALSQGSSDRFSQMYRAMTESYYRRLAEEGKPK